MSFIDELWLQNNLKENLIMIRTKKKRPEETWNQKVGLPDNTSAVAGPMFVIAFPALIITT